jgi:peptidoglycan/LPS O-acetylase OafA/YrhL
VDTKRLDHLDSIRGLAACIVLMRHCWNASVKPLSGIGAAFYSPTDFLCYVIQKFLAGYTAVIIFFVLSGFVLAYSLLKQPISYSGFTIKRFFRIYPIFILVIVASYALHLVVGVNHQSSEILEKSVGTPDLSFTSLLKHLALWGTGAAHSLDGVIWSLVHEMRISLIFPFILLALRKYGWRALLLFSFVSLACTILEWHTTGRISTGLDETTVFASFLATGFFTVFFAAGALLAVNRDRVALQVANIPRSKKILLFTIVAMCLLKSSDISSLNGIISYYMNGIGAVGLIAVALGLRQFRNVLNHNVPIWLGRISYSLYLVHLPIIYVVTQTIGESWSGIQTSAVVIALSLLAAELMAKFIEFPSIRLGKRLSQRAFASNAQTVGQQLVH